jgi:hypothetical protein
MTERFEESGWVDNKEDKSLTRLEFTEKEIDDVTECIKTNATLMAEFKERLLVKIRNAT